MKSVKYQRYQGDPLDELGMEQLADALADYLLQSGFQSPYDAWQELPGEQTLEELHQAIQQALANSDLLDEQQREFLANASPEKMAAVLNRLTERLAEEGLIRVDMPPASRSIGGGGSVGGERQVRFEITDKGLDFLGFRTLRDLLGGLGKASLGRHDTRDFATGVETSGASRPYEFGDTLNLDISATISHALRREGLHVPIGLEYQDLMVHQAEYQSSCATVLLLDCSHSMILYGEDRFTPAKRVALALSHLIRTQYPGDSLQLVLFHDSAEEIPLPQLARVQVGPHYTNTREGLRLAQRLLARQRKDMKQIVMITDGKPSALTLEDGRIYKNAFGLDPLVVGKTLEEVHRCRRSGILINTFMLASDYGLIQFVQKVTQICRGKAYFTTPQTLGQYLMLDYMTHKSRSIH
ncbi:MAG: vWA domain-containing protein [Terriglobales bacterium]